MSQIFLLRTPESEMCSAFPQFMESRDYGIFSRVVETPGGGAGILGLIFAGYVPLASQNPYPIVYAVAIL